MSIPARCTRGLSIQDYSAAIIRTDLRNVIEDHPLNKNYGLTADQIADLLEG
jgi:uncharacterized protein